MAKGVFSHSASRAKWQKIRRNVKIGDIVLLKNNTIRNQWPMVKVIDIYRSNDGHVRTVKLRVGNNKFNENGSKYLVRPIHKISCCSKAMRFDSPTEKQKTNTIKMMNHLEESHVLVVESCELWTLKPKLWTSHIWTLIHLISNFVCAKSLKLITLEENIISVQQLPLCLPLFFLFSSEALNSGI